MDEFPVDLDDEPSALSVCELCRSPELRDDFWLAFRVRVCEPCARANGSRGQTYGLITKSEAQVSFWLEFFVLFYLIGITRQPTCCTT